MELPALKALGYSPLIQISRIFFCSRWVFIICLYFWLFNSFLLNKWTFVLIISPSFYCFLFNRFKGGNRIIIILPIRDVGSFRNISIRNISILLSAAAGIDAFSFPLIWILYICSVYPGPCYLNYSKARIGLLQTTSSFSVIYQVRPQFTLSQRLLMT